MELMNINQIDEFRGRNFGLNEVRKIVTSGTMPLIARKNGKYLVKKQDAERLTNEMFSNNLELTKTIKIY